jgi:hypothetical protein
LVPVARSRLKQLTKGTMMWVGYGREFYKNLFIFTVRRLAGRAPLKTALMRGLPALRPLMPSSRYYGRLGPLRNSEPA